MLNITHRQLVWRVVRSMLQLFLWAQQRQATIEAFCMFTLFHSYLMNLNADDG